MIFIPNVPITQRSMRPVWPVAAPAVLTVGFGLAFLFGDESLLPRFGSMLLSAAGRSGFAVYLRAVQDLPPAALVSK